MALDVSAAPEGGFSLAAHPCSRSPRRLVPVSHLACALGPLSCPRPPLRPALQGHWIYPVTWSHSSISTGERIPTFGSLSGLALGDTLTFSQADLHVASALPCILRSIPRHFVLGGPCHYWYFPHFTGEETGWDASVTCPRTHMRDVPEPRFSARPV